MTAFWRSWLETCAASFGWTNEHNASLLSVRSLNVRSVALRSILLLPAAVAALHVLYVYISPRCLCLQSRRLLLLLLLLRVPFSASQCVVATWCNICYPDIISWDADDGKLRRFSAFSWKVSKSSQRWRFHDFRGLSLYDQYPRLQLKY